MLKNNNLEHKLTDFDPDFSPNHPTNIKAAEQRGWLVILRKDITPTKTDV